ncbi:MAG TPA: polyprenyl synthetase family protein, partial [Aggregatilineales bacterium]|nr:polyprenyl synthetase family protein [Aggregatilineales bacterium]
MTKNIPKASSIMIDFSTLLDAVDRRKTKINGYLFDDKHRIDFLHPHLRDAVYSYLKAGGKSLRPAVLLFSCGAVGGDENLAIPAAAAVELYHTWTLVHDDIIDRDEKRRGKPTVHAEFRDRGTNEFSFSDSQAQHYGLAIAILAGDMQQGWCTALLTNLSREGNVPPELTLNLVYDLFM